jgi:hypothetical protein
MSSPIRGFFEAPVVVARCNHCGDRAGAYFVSGEHRGWDRGWCTCTPAPRLPEGGELVAAIVRSLRRRRLRRGDPHGLPFKIRV